MVVADVFVNYPITFCNLQLLCLPPTTKAQKKPYFQFIHLLFQVRSYVTLSWLITYKGGGVSDSLWEDLFSLWDRDGQGEPLCTAPSPETEPFYRHTLWGFRSAETWKRLEILRRNQYQQPLISRALLYETLIVWLSVLLLEAESISDYS